MPRKEAGRQAGHTKSRQTVSGPVSAPAAACDALNVDDVMGAAGPPESVGCLDATSAPAAPPEDAERPNSQGLAGEGPDIRRSSISGHSVGDVPSSSPRSHSGGIPFF